MTPTYSVHLALHERINHLAACLFLPHQAKHVPLGLQGAGRTQIILSNGEKPIEEDVEDVDRNAFESSDRVFLRECAVPEDVSQIYVHST